VIEVKLGHQMSTTQQEKYEALRPRPRLPALVTGRDPDRRPVPSDAHRRDLPRERRAHPRVPLQRGDNLVGGQHLLMPARSTSNQVTSDLRSCGRHRPFG
jgi:hypothetical protein